MIARFCSSSFSFLPAGVQPLSDGDDLFSRQVVQSEFMLGSVVLVGVFWWVSLWGRWCYTVVDGW